MKKTFKEFYTHPGGWFLLIAILVMIFADPPGMSEGFIAGAAIGVFCYWFAHQERIVPSGYRVGNRDDGTAYIAPTSVEKIEKEEDRKQRRKENEIRQKSAQ